MNNILIQLFEIKWDKSCAKGQVFIPKTSCEMGEFSQISKKNLSEPMRIWTDYKRVNKTHFWSEISKSWWNFEKEDYLCSARGMVSSIFCNQLSKRFA